MKKRIIVLLVIIGLSEVVFAGECIRDVNETVGCADSGLVWQDNSSAKTIKKTWQEAINYCESLDFAGYHDWRLPNYNELESIVDYRKKNITIDSAFKNISNNFYWSSTFYAPDRDGAWLISFSDGSDGWGGESFHMYVRCVRAGQ